MALQVGESHGASKAARDPVPLPIYDSDFKANPYALYAQLHERGDDVVNVVLPNGVEGWLVIGHAQAHALLKDPRLSKNSAVAGPNWHEHHVNYKDGTSAPVFRHMLTMDPPEHTRLRALVQPEFGRANVETLRPHLAVLAQELLDGLAGCESFDLIESYALPLPLRVICMILGVPIADVHLFRRWSSLLVTANHDEQHMIPEAGRELHDYLVQLAADGPAPGSLFASLANLHRNGEFTTEELTSMGFLLLIAGHETTVNLIGNGVLALLRDGRAWKRVGRGRATVSSVVEELLRIESPIEVAPPRFVAEDMQCGGRLIRRGELVLIGLAAANRDPREFRDPERLIFGRPNAYQHLAFGRGVHFCLGSHLARLEAEVAFECLTRRYPDLALTQDPAKLRWRPGLVMRGLERLPVRATRGDSHSA